MCGDSSRISHGGLLAIIHPVPSALSAGPRHSLRNCRLLFFNDSSDRTTSRLQYDTDVTSTDAGIQRWEVRIHQSGQLMHFPSSHQVGFVNLFMPSNPVMYSFYIDRPVSAVPAGSGDSATSATVLQRINLGVGGTGVVGRTVSVVDEQQIVVGEGIIGWN